MTIQLAAGRIRQEQAEYALPRDPESPAAARHLVAGALKKWGVDPRGDLAADVILVVSELVTNAVTHGEGDAELTVRHAGDGIVVSVWDAAPMRPRTSGDPEHGRGLALISELAGSIAVVPGEPGKTVTVLVPFQSQSGAAA